MSSPSGNHPIMTPSGRMQSVRGIRRTRAFRWFGRYVALAQKRTGLLLLILGAVAAGALAMSLRLELHTDMAELLPDQHPAVLAFRRLAGRQKSATNLVMLIHGPDAEKNRRFAERLRPELEKMVPSAFTEIQWRPDTEVPDYAAKWKWLYAPKEDLDHAEELLNRVIASRTSPLNVDLDDDPEEELKKLREKLNQKLPEKKDTPYFEAKIGEQHYLGVMLWQRLDGVAGKSAHDTLDNVRATVERIGPKSIDPQLVVEYTGAIAQAIDEQNGIRDDLTIATVLVSLGVLGVILLYFRRLALLLVIGAPAVLGLLLALTIASVTVHYLNINTAFLISIILGNGINSPIILLARYGEERRHGQPVAIALTIAMSETLLATLTAMAAASIAYGCLLLTSFRGFNQFGLLGGAGMLLVWVMSFLLVPPMVIFGERMWPGSLTPRENWFRKPFAWIGGLSERRPGLLALAAIVLLGAAALPLYHYVKDPLEWNFENLRTDDTASQRLWPQMEALGMGDVGAGYIGNNGVLLVDKPEQADPVAAAMRAQDTAKGPQHVLKEVRTLSSTLPKDQTYKLDVLKRIRKKIDRHHDLMDDQERKEIDAWRPPDYLKDPLEVKDLPRLVREAFTETDGQQGRLIGIDADHSTYYDWNGHDLLRMSKALRVESGGKAWVAASTATIFAGMLETIINDGPRVTIAAIIGVTLLVLIAFGMGGAWPVMTSLAIGLMWLGGVLGFIHLKINFMNFVALPITLGVGADYAANIWARLRSEGLSKLASVIADTGSAVALCSSTTIIGYSSLLLSHNRALRSFGKLADLGEVTCLLAALVALPALLQFARGKKRKTS
jgi:predicted RND superfamily exporter protein